MMEAVVLPQPQFSLSHPHFEEKSLDYLSGNRWLVLAPSVPLASSLRTMGGF
jgi:hypothetical protein